MAAAASRSRVSVEPSEETASEPTHRGIDRYGLIGDSGTAALVSDEGSIDWLCLPRFDSDPVFASILDPRGGRFVIRPVGRFETTWGYVPGTAVLKTTFRTPGGIVELYDLFAARAGPAKRRRLWPFHYLIRRIVGVGGTVALDVELQPTDAFGGRRPYLAASGRRACAMFDADTILAECSQPWSVSTDAFRARLRVRAGERAYVTLAYADRDLGVWPPASAFAERVYEETVAYWRRWSDQARAFGPYADAIRRSALTLKLLTFAPSGAVVAAPTTSLPERIGGDRNWDYRYAWIRDASWTIVALTDLGYRAEARAYLSWVASAARLTEPYVHSLYRPYGGHRMREREVPRLAGFAGSRPVRVGNAAVGQLQLDNWGHLVDAAYVHAERLGPLKGETWSAVRSFVQFAADNWRRPDQGMWEVRRNAEHFVHSKIMCWVALDRGVRLVRDLGLDGPAEAWAREREAIRDAVLRRGVDTHRGNLVRAFGDTRVDASLLLAAQTGFLPPSDERIARTIEVVRADLGHGELIDRYHAEDGLGGGEGAFLACSFWLAHTLALTGRRGDAEEVFEAASNRANGLGLLPEQIDPRDGSFLGNFPQGLSHVALINAAIAIGKAR